MIDPNGPSLDALTHACHELAPVAVVVWSALAGAFGAWLFKVIPIAYRWLQPAPLVFLSIEWREGPLDEAKLYTDWLDGGVTVDSFVGRGLIWHRHPSGVRCPPALERKLCHLWTEQRWKRAQDKRGA